MDDPYPTYARLRAEQPLYHNAEHDFWVLSRHADVSESLRSDGVFSNAMGVSLDASAWGPEAHTVMSFLAMDPPRHMRLRGLVSKSFTPKRVAMLEPQVQALTERYLDEVLPRSGTAELEWIESFAGRLPMDVISELVGVPESDRAELRRLADLLVLREDGLRDVPPAGLQAAFDLFTYYGDHVAHRRRHPGDDLTSALLSAEADGDRMSTEEIVAFLFLMVVAGNETTTKLLGNALFHLSASPAQRDRVFAEGGSGPDAGPALVRPWIEETLRYDNSTQLVARHLLADVSLHGVTAPAGARLLLAYGSANRDATVFPDPDVYDLDRPREQLARLLSFGGGRHFCLGSNLARLEARVALTELVRRVRSVEVHPQRCVRFYSSNVRGFASVPITVEAR
ncbi:cytochrome P450 [Spongisporangium articulatum]|uniref:Cytochrome P450 n=1 Tax=Spongisporangium articulatum TaxID=3362603 RepID=A0ABW8AUR1_9ACTN